MRGLASFVSLSLRAWNRINFATNFLIALGLSSRSPWLPVRVPPAKLTKRSRRGEGGTRCLMATSFTTTGVSGLSGIFFKLANCVDIIPVGRAWSGDVLGAQTNFWPRQTRLFANRWRDFSNKCYQHCQYDSTQLANKSHIFMQIIVFFFFFFWNIWQIASVFVVICHRE